MYLTPERIIQGLYKTLPYSMTLSGIKDAIFKSRKVRTHIDGPFSYGKQSRSTENSIGQILRRYTVAIALPIVSIHYHCADNVAQTLATDIAYSRLNRFQHQVLYKPISYLINKCDPLIGLNKHIYDYELFGIERYILRVSEGWIK